MKTAGKLLKWILSVIAVADRCWGSSSFFSPAISLIKIGIEKAQASALKVPVELGSISVHPFGRQGGIEKPCRS